MADSDTSPKTAPMAPSPISTDIDPNGWGTPQRVLDTLTPPKPRITGADVTEAVVDKLMEEIHRSDFRRFKPEDFAFYRAKLVEAQRKVRGNIGSYVSGGTVGGAMAGSFGVGAALKELAAWGIAAVFSDTKGLIANVAGWVVALLFLAPVWWALSVAFKRYTEWNVVLTKCSEAIPALELKAKETASKAQSDQTAKLATETNDGLAKQLEELRQQASAATTERDNILRENNKLRGDHNDLVKTLADVLARSNADRAQADADRASLSAALNTMAEMAKNPPVQLTRQIYEPLRLTVSTSAKPPTGMPPPTPKPDDDPSSKP